ncbi:hypothetical protein [Paraburkholderia aromaticivorans]|uniref:hypothetical protein n=1 Tax=Paraburkholderia aromaticivorans TaxID=2026199 RepID=UPI00145602B6|nr:hypothetical protein [Paraburkholderia aromaticivorans]
MKPRSGFYSRRRLAQSPAAIAVQMKVRPSSHQAIVSVPEYTFNPVAPCGKFRIVFDFQTLKRKTGFAAALFSTRCNAQINSCDARVATLKPKSYTQSNPPD